MARLETATVTVDLSEINEARLKVKRLIKDLNDLNRLLARTQENLLGVDQEILAQRGIRLELEI